MRIGRREMAPNFDSSFFRVDESRWKGSDGMKTGRNPRPKVIRKCVCVCVCVFFSYRVLIIGVARPIPAFLHSLLFHPLGCVFPSVFSVFLAPFILDSSIFSPCIRPCVDETPRGTRFEMSPLGRQGRGSVTSDPL